ncbi:MAG: peptide transporter [Anaerolineae bacterium]|jgi:ornithine cyclodeaminase/alanine dehydrogenase|nr:MAG: peptide transporter [Anaerolineae bacterium]
MKDLSLLYLSRQDVETVGLDLPTIIELLEKAFRNKGEGSVELPPKPGIHTRPNAFIHAMPAYIPALHSAGIKWVSGYPDNPQRGLPYISGLIILNDEENGLPYAVMDCTWITAYRTGAASAVSAKYLARPDSKTLGIIGCGVQGRTHTEAMTTLFPIERVYAYDILPAAQEKFISEMGAKFPDLEFIPTRHPKEVVTQSEIVLTAGPILKNPTPTIEKDWLQPGAFATAVDFDSYWKGEALQQMDKFTTDDLAQMEYYRTLGYFKDTPQPYADLGEIVVGKKPGRESPSERCMAMNLGLALDDMAIAPTIYQRAVEMGLGVRLPL